MKKAELTADKRRFTRIKNRKNLRSFLFVNFVFLCLTIFAFLFVAESPQKASAEESQTAFENALYRREEFFGAEAIVPLPTAEARANLARLAQSEPNDARILEKLSELEEKSSDFAAAERTLIRLTELDFSKLENLAAFYHRRARFESEAEILRKMLFAVEAKARPAVFGRLINVARKHELKQYLNNDFYVEVAKENAGIYEIFDSLIENLIEAEDFDPALNFIRQAKTQFPERKMLEMEIDVLLKTNRAREAETIYQSAFDPFWSETEADKFYRFLGEQDRLRAYGAELKQKLKQNPADADAAIRYALYRKHDYRYGNDEIAPTILNLEKAKKSWTTAELVTIARLLLRENEAEAASRFLYTIYLREDFKKTGELRAKILYQLFEMFSDAENRKLPLTKGDLRFYEDIARADTNPGIATGVLSLVFSDANPKERLLEQESRATESFNRAAAYRIFLEYKKEFPTSNELAQMYLDVVRLYTATKEPEIAAAALAEFEQRYEKSDDYAAVTLKLADAFVAAAKPEKSREIYQKLLDYLGKKSRSLAPAAANVSKFSNEFAAEHSSAPNDGINIPDERGKSRKDFYHNQPAGEFHDYLGRKTVAIAYADVLEKLVASLAAEKRVSEILALYSNEIKKYGNAEWLYEQRLQWLEGTNLIEEQLKVYQAALARFESRGWQDKLARWFLRQNRQQDFADFSQNLIGKLNDAELQNYLSQFVGENVSATVFERQLYFKLYTAAHERFPHNAAFVNGLLRFYKIHKWEDEWRRLAARYYFESKEIREQFLGDLARKNELRAILAKATGEEGIVYELFRADAAARLSNYERAVEAYRKLNRLYPQTPEFSARLTAFARSFGQKNRESSKEAAALARAEADFLPASAEALTRSGEIYAELGLYDKAREQWEKLIPTARGEKEIYLTTATVYWDYFQYEDALRTIQNLRAKFADETLHSFEAGAILEARREPTRAIGEYVKALDAENRDETQKSNAVKRLKILVAKEPQAAKTIDSAFEIERQKRKNSDFLTLGYAEFLAKIKQTERAQTILNRAVGQSANQAFVEAALEFYRIENHATGERAALKRLAEIVSSPRQAISYRLQLAESFESSRNRDSAKAVLAHLLGKFPTNYGVLSESADFYRRLGFENESIAVLQNALPLSRGRYRTALAQKLAARLIRLDRLDSAERILSSLHGEDRANVEIFRQLAEVCVRTGKTENLRKAFGETIAALKQTDADRRELDEQIADLRGQMIAAFTIVKDYKSAIEQHIEIINRQPDDETLVRNAISYVERYGGADALLNYYLKLGAEAFKNYRWNVVLARIYAALGDLENAVKNYESAIVNQPEMIELYLALADVETKRNNFDKALKNLDRVLEFTNDAPEYVKKKIEVLKKTGRFAEIEIEKAKLPAEENSKNSTDHFAEAQKLQNTEKARELYREAFARLLENPLGGELKASDVGGYVNSLREEEPLDEINLRLWQLREKLIKKADETDSIDAGEARKRRAILESAMIEAVGNIAKTIGTDEEFKSLHEDLRRRIEAVSTVNDRNQTISLVQDVSRRAGFGDLEEAILLKKLNEAKFSSDRQIYLQSLISFYNERGAYQKTFELLEKYETENLSLKAETARLVGYREKELQALRMIYWKGNEDFVSAHSDAAARYLEILDAENRAELKSLTEKSSPHQLQLINFLLGKGERELAHAAIENAALPQAWKTARHAETSLALKEFDERAECFFCEALQLDRIGKLVEQKPHKQQFLAGDDWFRLARGYGEWLFEREDKVVPPARFLIAMVENQPRNAVEQSKLASFYQARNQSEAAIEHFRLALEIAPDDKTIWSALGAAYHRSGNKERAEECWKNALADEDAKSGLAFFLVLQKNGLAQTAREKLLPIIVKFLQNNNADDSTHFQHLIRAVAASFADEREKAAYFLQILNKRPTDESLAAMIVGESLVAKNRQNEFYELLIERGAPLGGYEYDYDFASIKRRVWTSADAESIYDQENKYEIEEPETERVERQRKYLQLLIEQGENSKAEWLIRQIEKDLNRRYARPEWLRLAKIRLQIRRQKFDSIEAERFIGIWVSDSATETRAPSLERFNQVSQILKEENSENEKTKIAESFFARMLAVGRFDETNFVGLARVLFEREETEKALHVLKLMVSLGDETSKESALAEIAALDLVKSKAADKAKLTETETLDSINRANALKIAAEIAAEFKQIDAAIAFRRRLLEISPAIWSNKIALAEILSDKGEKQEAVNLLNEIADARAALRASRWRAQMILREIGENAQFADEEFDVWSQFYNGLLARRDGRNDDAEQFFLNSLIAENDAENPAREELIKLYAASNKPFAALKLAETNKAAKPDALLETLSAAAEKIGDYPRAIDFERSKSDADEERIAHLQRLNDEKNQKATDFTIDLENTRKL